jgi:2-isopropylmalate synthase
LDKLKEINEKAFRLSGIPIPELRAFVGDNAFSHKAGVHTDAMNKGASYEHMNPELIGNESRILLNTFGGASCVLMIAREFGYDFDKKDSAVQDKIRNLFFELTSMEHLGYRIGAIKAEQFLLIEKYFGNLKDFFHIYKWRSASNMDKNGEESESYLKIRVNGDIIEESLKLNGGPVDAGYKTLYSALYKKYPEIKNLELIDFHVEIAKQKKEESSVRTEIEFLDKNSDGRFHTVGVDSNILLSSFEAIVKGFRYYLNKHYKEKAI